MTNEKKKRIILVVIISLAAMLLIGGIVGVVAKYLNEKDYGGNSVSAESFYFTVDLLGDTNTKDSLTKDIHIYGTKEGEPQILPFSVRNYYDAFRITPADISYKISLETTVPGTTLKKGEQTISGTSDAFILTSSESSEDEYTLSLPNEGFSDGDTVKVIVKSSSPYKKTITLNFILHTYDYDLTYRVEDAQGNAYAELIIMTSINVDARKIVVDWSDINSDATEISVDSTNELVYDKDPVTGEISYTTNNPDAAEDGTLVSIKLTRSISALESVSIYFFKADINKDFSTEMSGAEYASIGVEEQDGVYTIKLTKKGAV